MLSREERAARRDQFLQALAKADKEEEEKDANEKKFTQLINSEEKVTLRDFQLKKVVCLTAWPGVRALGARRVEPSRTSCAGSGPRLVRKGHASA